MIPGLRRCGAAPLCSGLSCVESRRCAVGGSVGARGAPAFLLPTPTHPTPSRLDGGCGWCGHADACTHVCTGGEIHTQGTTIGKVR